jgi:hypothetical protein
MFGLKRSTHKDRDEGLTLPDIIRGLQYCVNSSQDIAEWHHIGTIGRFLRTEAGEENITPKDINKVITQTIKLNDTMAMDVPLISLADHSSLILDEMKVNLSLNLKDAGFKKQDVEISKKQNGVTNGSVDRAAFNVDLRNAQADNKSTRIDLQLTFKVTNPPEAVSRIVDKLNDQLRIYEIDPKTGNRIIPPNSQPNNNAAQ